MTFVERLRCKLARMLWPSAFVPPQLPQWTYAADGLWSVHPADFLNDPLFRRAYEAGRSTGSWGEADVRWRAHVVCWAAKRGAALDGDLVECGVNRGGYSRMLADYVDLASFPGKKLYLLDTFAGMPEAYVTEELRPYCERMYGDSYDDVLATFRSFPNAVVVRGTIPDTLEHVVPERVCYLSIDLNCVEPSIAAAEHFWERLVPGAAIVLDDYGHARFADQRAAFDDFASRHGVPLLSLPTGQGLILKG